MTSRRGEDVPLKMADYDTTEATIILKRLVNERDNAGRLAATKKLLGALEALFVSDGGNFEITNEEHIDPDEFHIFRGRAEICRFFVQPDGSLHVRSSADKSPAAGPMKLAYDGAFGLWVGEEDDTTKHPTPGERREKRSALAVVVGEIDSIYRAMYKRR